MVNNLSYVLDPDLAIPKIVTKDNSNFGPIYDIKYNSIKKIYNLLDRRDASLKTLTLSDVQGSVAIEAIKYLLDRLEIIRWSSMRKFNPNITYYTVRKIIDSFTWNGLTSIRKQYYIPITDTYKERYRLGMKYADIDIPARGSYTSFVHSKNKLTIEVREQKSDIPANSIRSLIRLRDGSLLELYDINFNPDNRSSDVELYYLGMDLLITIDPSIIKQFFLSQGLNNLLGRPAYRLPLIITEELLTLGQ